MQCVLYGTKKMSNSNKTYKLYKKKYFRQLRLMVIMDTMDDEMVGRQWKQLRWR